MNPKSQRAAQHNPVPLPIILHTISTEGLGGNVPESQVLGGAELSILLLGTLQPSPKRAPLLQQSPGITVPLSETLMHLLVSTKFERNKGKGSRKVSLISLESCEEKQKLVSGDLQKAESDLHCPFTRVHCMDTAFFT